MRRFPYIIVDVFTDTPLQGNPLRVFTDATGLGGEEMQALAKETNLSETTFVLPRKEAAIRERGHKVRIFTVAEELPFAGHPILGTAAVLRGMAQTSAWRIELDLRAGKVPVDFEKNAPRAAPFGEMQQLEPRFGARYPRETIARIAGLAVDDLRADVPIETVNTGLPFMIVPVASLAALGRLRLDANAAEETLRRSDAKFIYFLCREARDPAAHAQARMIFYGGEDPATGSAAGCAAAWMARHEVAPSGKRVLIEQGVEMGRRSRLYVSAEKHGDAAKNVRVGGNVVEVARGEFFLP